MKIIFIKIMLILFNLIYYFNWANKIQIKNFKQKEFIIFQCNWKHYITHNIIDDQLINYTLFITFFKIANLKPSHNLYNEWNLINKKIIKKNNKITLYYIWFKELVIIIIIMKFQHDTLYFFRLYQIITIRKQNIISTW